MAQQSFFKRPAVSLALSCAFLFLLYFLMESIQFWGPKDDVALSFIILIFLGAPAFYIAPVIAFSQGIWFACGARWKITPFCLRFLSIMGGCIFGFLMNEMAAIARNGWWWSREAIGLLPPFAFLLAGILTRIGIHLYKWFRAQTPQEHNMQP